MKLFVLSLFFMRALIGSASSCCEELTKISPASSSPSEHTCCHESNSQNESKTNGSSNSNEPHLGYCSHACCSLYNVVLNANEINFKINSEKPYFKIALAPKHVFLSVPKRPPKLV
ncbi:MAG: hypothetical protein FJ116_09600 [Deltaproteobacteria bacterium]|nr:hypothetical protein [Deltaproteobacteria bacterium]